MKLILSNQRSKAIFSILIVALGIGSLSKKVISYPTGGCIKEAQELTFRKQTNKYHI